jgi:hypothetical protein
MKANQDHGRFGQIYVQAYATLGLDLTENDAISEQFLSRFERKMKIRLPRALRAYYVLAGNEIEFNTVFERLLPPTEWWFDDGKLVFMEENQAVVVWGVEITKRPPQDPPVFQGVNVEAKRLEWHLEHEQCSVFLTTMLHWQGAYGGAMSYTETAVVPPQLRERLDAEWSLVGEVNAMRAYNRPGEAICLLEWEDNWRVFAGASKKSMLSRLARELGIKWDAPEHASG